MNKKQIEGKVGEIEAAIYLKEKGYTIICMNFKCMKGEIDIIAEKDGTVIFVEVKTRTSKKYGEAREAVNKEKQKHIYETARYFLYKTKMEYFLTRIDVIEVYFYKRRKNNKSHRASNVRPRNLINSQRYSG